MLLKRMEHNPYAKNEAPIKTLGSYADAALARAQAPKKRKGIHSELHEVVATLRQEFGETAKKGKGSFGFYLRLLKSVPISTLHIWLANVKDSPNLDTPLARGKVFWWKYKQWKAPKVVKSPDGKMP